RARPGGGVDRPRPPAADAGRRGVARAGSGARRPGPRPPRRRPATPPTRVARQPSRRGDMTDPTQRLSPVVRLAPAKINLTLAVVGRRGDGFHDLHSVVVPLALADRLSVAPRPAGGDDSPHVTPLHGVRRRAGEALPGVLLVTPAMAVHTAAVFAAWSAGAMAEPGIARRTSEHFASEFGSGLSVAQLVERAAVLASANDLAAAAAHVIPELVPFRRTVMRLLGRPVGLTGSGPTLWVLYPSLEEAGVAAGTLTTALEEGRLTGPGSGRPFVTATTIAAGPEAPE